MSFLDKTFCASPQCQNECGRRMTDAQRDQLTYGESQHVSYAYFCGEGCHHESDGLIYTNNPPQNKCIKCKEFYR